MGEGPRETERDVVVSAFAVVLAVAAALLAIVGLATTVESRGAVWALLGLPVIGLGCAARMLWRDSVS